MAKNFGRVNVSITASTGGLTAGLSNASKQLRGFGGQVQGIGGRLQGAAASFVGLGRGASLGAIGVRALSLAIKSLLAPLLIVTSLVSVFRKLADTARTLDELSKTARRLGMSVTAFQNLGQAAEEAGISVEQLGGLMTFMTRNIGNLTNGSRTAQAAFGRLGLSLEDIRNLSPEAQFELISQRIMALPSAAQRTAAAMSIFGRQGALAMGLISDAAGGAVSDISRLREQLGLNLTDEQTKGIEMMNDALARMSLVFDGFYNQFIAELAPAITTVANLFVRFFAENTSGWNTAIMLAQFFTGYLRLMVGYWTMLYGVVQVAYAIFAKFFALVLPAVGLLAEGLAALAGTLSDAANALGMTGLGDQLAKVAGNQGKFAKFGREWANAAAAEAAVAWDNGIANITNPFAAFDTELAKVTATMNDAGASAGQQFAAEAGNGISAAVRASSEALKAVVVGTSAGEEFRNSILRGADPRLAGDAAQDTADNTAEMVDQLDELNGQFAGLGGGGLGTATIAV